MRFAWLGAGEFEDWHVDVDRWLLDSATDGGRVLILPTASACEGDVVFDGWGSKGLTHYEGSGTAAQVVPLKTREDASREDLVALLDEASVVFFSGGNPAYLAEVLTGTPFWNRMLVRMAEGLAYAGCSAGVACLPDFAPDSDAEEINEGVMRPGLGLVKGAWLMPHWDMLDVYVPGLTSFITSMLPVGTLLVAIDEQTAMIGDGTSWMVTGRSSVHLLEDGSWTDHPAGDSFERTLV